MAYVNLLKHWELAEYESINFTLMNAPILIDKVHEFYNICGKKKITIECRDNCSFCAVSERFKVVNHKKNAYAFSPKEYSIFNVLINHTVIDIAEAKTVKVVKLPQKMCMYLHPANLMSYQLLKKDRKYTLISLEEGKVDDVYVPYGLDDFKTNTTEDYANKQLIQILEHFNQ